MSDSYSLSGKPSATWEEVSIAHVRSVSTSTYTKRRVHEARDPLLLVDGVQGLDIRRVQLDGLEVVLDAGWSDGLGQDGMTLADWVHAVSISSHHTK